MYVWMRLEIEGDVTFDRTMTFTKSWHCTNIYFLPEFHKEAQFDGEQKNKNKCNFVQGKN